MSALAIIRASPTAACLPWPRHLLHPASWAQLAASLATTPTLSLRGLWADTTHVHALLLDESGTDLRPGRKWRLPGPVTGSPGRRLV